MQGPNWDGMDRVSALTLLLGNGGILKIISGQCDRLDPSCSSDLRTTLTQ